MRTLKAKEFYDAPAMVQHIYMCALMDQPIGCDLYNEAIEKYPEYFPDEVEHKKNPKIYPIPIKMKAIKGNFTIAEYKSRLNQLITLYNKIHDERLPPERKSKPGFFSVEESAHKVTDRVDAMGHSVELRISIVFNELRGYSEETKEEVYEKYYILSRPFAGYHANSNATMKDSLYKAMYEEFITYSLFAVYQQELKDANGKPVKFFPIQHLMMVGLEEEKEVKERVEK